MFQMPGYDCGFLCNTPLLVYLQPTKLSDAQALPRPGQVKAREDYSLVVTCTRRRSICYPYSRHSLQAQAPLNLSVMTCHSLERTQADPLCLSKNLISQHARQSNRAEKLPSRPGFEPRLARVISPSGQQVLWPIQWSSPLSHRDRLEKQMSVSREPLTNTALMDHVSAMINRCRQHSAGLQMQ